VKRLFLFSLVISFGIWAWFSWPLPRYAAAGIPAAAHLEPALVRPLIPGDHLQFMYYCWLAGDMASGKTPLFYDLYEFNTGGEISGYRPYANYFPFSLIYSGFAMAGGRALGWNLTGFLSLWMTYFLTWLLARRYTKPDWSHFWRDKPPDDSDWIAGCAAVIAITLPFRWINLFGGSPAGFACMWIPAILLGIDIAVRDGRAAGGFLAGISILCASWTDNHIFFFGSLAIPIWTLIALAAELNRFQNWRESWQNIFIALLPLPLLFGLALAFPTIIQQIAGAATDQHVGSSVATRVFREIALYSPHAADFFAWISPGIVSQHVYIGISILVFLTAGLACLLVAACRRGHDSRHRLFVIVLLLAGVAGIMALALGTNGPFQALLFRICRKVIPRYDWIRQPAKIFCLMPAFLAVATGLGLSAIFVHLKSSQVKFIAALLFCGAIGTEYFLRVHPTISILDSNQDAYEAVAKDAAAAGKPPHVLIIPLWPGDAADSSIYQYYVSLYRIRMVNGYNPFVSKFYRENVFRRYESVNQGWLTDDQIDGLLRRKIDYLILHEDLFPEKVSPFPIGWTLKQLLEHRRLQLLRQDGRVWAFKMLAKPEELGSLGKAGQSSLRSQRLYSGGAGHVPPRSLPSGQPDRQSGLTTTDKTTKTGKAIKTGVASNAPTKTNPSQLWSIFGCARQWQAENCMKGKAFAARSPAPTHDAYAILDSQGAVVLTPPQRTPAIAPLNWLVRMRGEGTIIAQTIVDGKPSDADLVDISEDEWNWVSIPVPDLGVFAPLNLKLEWENGAIECDRILLTAGEWIPPAKGRTIEFPAPCMFHAGYTSLDDNAVVLEKEREACALIFYGPKLPLEKGRYRIELVFTSPAPRGALLGQFNVKRHERDVILNWTPVVSGARSPAEFTQTVNEPMHLEFRFLGNGSLKITSIRLTRLD